MRMTEAFFSAKVGEVQKSEYFYPATEAYAPAIKELARVTSVDESEWFIIFDSQQRATHEGGKSSCAYLVANHFENFEEAMQMVSFVIKSLPTVNIEMQIAPDGWRDQGDGPGSYSFPPNCPYIKENGFSVAVLIDAQNVLRHLKAQPNHTPEIP